MVTGYFPINRRPHKVIASSNSEPLVHYIRNPDLTKQAELIQSASNPSIYDHMRENLPICSHVNFLGEYFQQQYVIYPPPNNNKKKKKTSRVLPGYNAQT